MSTNSQLSTTEPKRKEKKKKIKTKQTTRTGTESEKWTSHGGISVGRGKGEMGDKGTGKKKYKIRHKQGGRHRNGIGNRTQRTYMYKAWT